jgi:hypothetical protein
MFRSLVAALSFVSILVVLVIVGVLTLNFFKDSLSSGTPAGEPADSVVLRISGTSGVQFSGNYTTPNGSQNISGTLGTTPVDYKIKDEGAADVNVVTVNVRRLSATGNLKVEILKNGQVVQSGETNVANNTVSLTFSL